MDGAQDPEREYALSEYKRKLIESREWEAKLKALRLEIKGQQRDFDVSEENIKALQSVGQIIGEVLKQLDDERCKQWIRVQHCHAAIVTDIRRLQSSLKPLQALAMSLDVDQRSKRPNSSREFE